MDEGLKREEMENISRWEKMGGQKMGDGLMREEVEKN